jgi:hypothetical protein
MKTSFKTLLVLAAFGTFATTSCTDNQQEKAGNTADNAGNAVENATDSVKADMAREPGDTAVVVDKPANGVVEKTPATPQK